MEQISAVNLFRNDIVPAWADPENKAGGEYQIYLDDTMKPETIDEIWQDLVLLLIGETLKSSEQVNNSDLLSFFLTGYR